MVRGHWHIEVILSCDVLFTTQFKNPSNWNFLADDDLRRELHEMLIPAALKETWTELKNSVSLCTYHFKFCPNPIDRLYREFALFVKSPLPKEAEKMKLDLHLDRGRSVLTELVPYGVVKFTKDEVKFIISLFLFFHLEVEI